MITKIISKLRAHPRRVRDHTLVTFLVVIATFVPEHPWIALTANMTWIWIDVLLEESGVMEEAAVTATDYAADAEAAV